MVTNKQVTDWNKYLGMTFQLALKKQVYLLGILYKLLISESSLRHHDLTIFELSSCLLLCTPLVFVGAHPLLERAQKIQTHSSSTFLFINQNRFLDNSVYSFQVPCEKSDSLLLPGVPVLLSSFCRAPAELSDVPRLPWKHLVLNKRSSLCWDKKQDSHYPDWLQVAPLVPEGTSVLGCVWGEAHKPFRIRISSLLQEGCAGQRLGQLLRRHLRAADGCSWEEILQRFQMSCSVEMCFCWNPSGHLS